MSSKSPLVPSSTHTPAFKSTLDYQFLEGEAKKDIIKPKTAHPLWTISDDFMKKDQNHVKFLNRIEENTPLVGLWIAEKQVNGGVWVVGRIKKATWQAAGDVLLRIEFPGHEYNIGDKYVLCSLDVHRKNRTENYVLADTARLFKGKSNRQQVKNKDDVVIAVFPQSLLNYSDKDSIQQSALSMSTVSQDVSHREELLRQGQKKLSDDLVELQDGIEQLEKSQIALGKSDNHSLDGLTQQLKEELTKTAKQKEKILQLKEANKKNTDEIATTYTEHKAQLLNAIKEAKVAFTAGEENQKRYNLDRERALQEETDKDQKIIKELTHKLAEAKALTEQEKHKFDRMTKDTENRNKHLINGSIAPLEEEIKQLQEEARKYRVMYQDLEKSESIRSAEMGAHIKSHRELLQKSQDKSKELEKALARSSALYEAMKTQKYQKTAGQFRRIDEGCMSMSERDDRFDVATPYETTESTTFNNDIIDRVLFSLQETGM
jgi:hypothetical protein